MAQKKIPARQCIGCLTSRPKKELVRVVRAPSGEISIDPVGKKPGRGAYLCPDAACLAKAKKKKALERCFEQPDRKNCCEEDINKGNVSPGIFSGGDRKSHTDCQSCYGADKTYNGCFPAGKVEFLLQYAKYHSE